MSAAPASWISSPRLAPTVANHPLSPLTAFEISTSSQLIHRLYPPRTNLHFKAVTLQEPDKAHTVPYLEAEHFGTNPSSIDRRSFVCYYIRNTVSLKSHVARAPLCRDGLLTGSSPGRSARGRGEPHTALCREQCATRSQRPWPRRYRRDMQY